MIPNGEFVAKMVEPTVKAVHSGYVYSSDARYVKKDSASGPVRYVELEFDAMVPDDTISGGCRRERVVVRLADVREADEM